MQGRWEGWGGQREVWEEEWEGDKEDVSIAFHSKVHGGQEAGMRQRSKVDSSLKVY